METNRGIKMSQTITQIPNRTAGMNFHTPYQYTCPPDYVPPVSAEELRHKEIVSLLKEIVRILEDIHTLQ
jgi:hypothetical protein